MDLQPSVPTVDPLDAQPDQLRRSGSLLARLQISPWDATGLAATLLLLAAFAPDLMFPGWTPRMVLLVGFGSVGVVLLATLVRRRDGSAALLAAALVWTVVVSVVSAAPRSALLGVVGRDLSALVVALSAGMWALGRLMTQRGKDVLTLTITWTLTVGAVVGLLQLVLDVTTGPLALAFGRPTGFNTNPVYFGALCAAGLATAQSLWVGRWRAVLVPIVLLGVGVSISGSRVALAAALVVAALIAVAARTRQATAGAAVVIASLAGGVVLDRLSGAGANAVDRLSDQSSGGRLEVWRYGLQAWGDRPVTGYGFGQFRPAVQHRFSADFVRVSARDEVSQAWFDPHNVGLVLLVSVGAVGTLLFLSWAVHWGRGIRGPLAWTLLPIVLHWMLQPVSLFTLPLAMLIFGAATRREPDQPPRSPRTVGVVAVLGVLLAGALLGGDVMLRRAANSVDAPRAEAVAQWFGRDPIVGDVVAQVYQFDERVPDRPEQHLRWRSKVAEFEPDRPFWWSNLAMAQIEVGDYDAARESLATAYELQRYNTRTLRADMVLAVLEGDVDRLGPLLDEACDLGMPECGTSAADLIAEANDLAREG